MRGNTPGAELAAERKAAGFVQRDVARKRRVSAAAIGQMELKAKVSDRAAALYRKTLLEMIAEKAAR